MAPLHGAVAVADVDHVSVGVGEDLDLNVAGVGEVALEVDLAVAEGRGGLPDGGVEGVLGLRFGVDAAHAASAAAG